MAIETEYIKLKKAVQLYKDIGDEDDILMFAIEDKISLYHWPGHWYKVPFGPLHDLLEGAETVTTPFYTKITGAWKTTELKEVDPNGKVIKTTKNRQWSRNILYVKRDEIHKVIAKNTYRDIGVVELLENITKDMYPEGMTSRGRGGLTRSINTLKSQLPKAFDLCFRLLYEHLESSKIDQINLTEADIKKRAKEVEVGTAMAIEIHNALPPALQGQRGRKTAKTINVENMD